MGHVRAAHLLAAAAALLTAAPAVGAEVPKPPRANGPISVYVEQIPTAKGSVAAGASNNSAKALSKDAEKELETKAGDDAEQLETLATSSGYGAPQSTAAPSPKPVAKPKAKTQPRPAPTTDTRTTAIRPVERVAAPAAAAQSRDGNTALWAAVACLALAAAAATGAAVAIRRRRAPAHRWR